MIRAQSSLGAGGRSLAFDGTTKTVNNGDHNTEYFYFGETNAVVTLPGTIDRLGCTVTFWQFGAGKVQAVASGGASIDALQDTVDAFHRYTAGPNCAMTCKMVRNVDGNSAQWVLIGMLDYVP